MAVQVRGGRAARARNYPPLVAAGLAAVLLLAIFPSSLNLPTTAPPETLEFAPVPPEDDVNPPPAGNFSSLGLAGGSSIGAGGAGEAALADDEIGVVPGGRGKTPSTKRCVGNPPRQSEDPLSPPCAAFFDGDNQGETYQGVTRDEVRVLFYVNCCINYVGGTREARSLLKTPT